MNDNQDTSNTVETELCTLGLLQESRLLHRHPHSLSSSDGLPVVQAAAETSLQQLYTLMSV